MPHASGISPAPWRGGLAARIFFAATLLVVVVLGLTFGLTSLQAHRTADESIRHALVGRRRGVQAFLAGRTTAFAGMSGVSAQVPQFRERLLQRSRGDVLDQAEEYRHLLGASWVLVTNERGLLVARTDYPAEFDIDLSRGALIARALSGEQADGAWLDDRAQRLYMAVAIPLRASPDAAPQGVLVSAYEVGDTLAQEIKQATGSDVVFFALDTLDHPHVVASTLPREDIGTVLAADPGRRVALATRRVQDGDYSVEIDVPSGDELGVLARAFRSLVEDLKEKAALEDYMMATSRAAPTQRLRDSSAGQALRPDTVFAGRYEVKEVLGRGGMGVVYRAFDRELQEPVAIKTLREDALAGDSVALERFKQEIRLARKIAHRNVVRTYDLGEVDGTYYLTMEYVEGTSLKQLISSRGRLPTAVTLTIGKQLCRALEVAHEQGIIHRDIKPQNIVVEPSGFLKVMDFGIARLANPPQGKGLTQEGASIGTPDYMSPEQLLGMELDARSDLYAAGVVLFECVAGRVPFDGESVYAVVAKHLEEPAPDPRKFNAAVPEALAQVILKAMAKERGDRYQTAAEMHDALAAIG